eukprot:g2893.t1
MIPRSLKLEDSERKYRLVLDKRKKAQALSKKRRDGLLQLVGDCISGKQKMFGGRFAKPARRNKIILDKISSIEHNVESEKMGMIDTMINPKESPIKKYLEKLNKNDKNRDILVAAERDTETKINNGKAIETLENKMGNNADQHLFRNAFKSPLQPSLRKKNNLSETIAAINANTKSLTSTNSVSKEPLTDLYAAGIEINGSYYSGRVQAYIGNFWTKYPVMALITLENIDDLTLFENNTRWVEIPNVLKNVSNKKLLGQNILKSISITKNSDNELPLEIVFDEEKCILFCEFL